MTVKLLNDFFPITTAYTKSLLGTLLCWHVSTDYDDFFSNFHFSDYTLYVWDGRERSREFRRGDSFIKGETFN